MSGSYKSTWRKCLRIPRSPDFTIGSPGNPYLHRWWIIKRNNFFNIYLHHFLRSDDDRALHDHPWWNLSVLLTGRYLEHIPHGVKVRRRGQLVLRKATHRHRVELIDGPVWTLFITGPKIREWGFWCPQGFKHWSQFTKPGKSGEIGLGCDD